MLKILIPSQNTPKTGHLAQTFILLKVNFPTRRTLSDRLKCRGKSPLPFTTPWPLPVSSLFPFYSLFACLCRDHPPNPANPKGLGSAVSFLSGSGGWRSTYYVRPSSCL